jgi:hypothetical protein
MKLSFFVVIEFGYFRHSLENFSLSPDFCLAYLLFGGGED